MQGRRQEWSAQEWPCCDVSVNGLHKRTKTTYTHAKIHTWRKESILQNIYIMMRKSGESVKKIQFWLIISFKKTQKQRCSELNCLRMIRQMALPLGWHFKGRWRPTQNIKQICPRKIDKILTFLLPGRKTSQIYDTALLMNLTKAPQYWVSHELTRKLEATQNHCFQTQSWFIYKLKTDEVFVKK